MAQSGRARFETGHASDSTRRGSSFEHEKVPQAWLFSQQSLLEWAARFNQSRHGQIQTVKKSLCMVSLYHIVFESTV